MHIDRVEIKDVALPESMKRSMSRQAEAERERRARVITAEGELQASEKLAQAAAAMADTPAALQLRLLETVVEVAAEKNSTLVLPFPVELLRFLERATPADVANTDVAKHPNTDVANTDVANTDVATPIHHRIHTDIANTDITNTDITNTDPSRTPTAPISDPTPRPEPPDVASPTAEATCGAGVWDNGAAQDAPLSVPLRQGPSRWWG